MYLIIYLVAAIWFLLPTPAYAYLDPGTGNALIYAALSFIGAILFSLKGIFYALIGKKDVNNEAFFSADKNGIVIFSEGKAYWYTFKPIVEALLRKGQPFSYYTMDIEDPCLTIDNPHLFNRYIGSGNRAFAKIGNIKAGILLSTTPNIGTKGYPIPRSQNIRELVHVFHSLVFVYQIGSMDFYDTVLLGGAFEEPVIRNIEEDRNLVKKVLIPAGVPYFDVLKSAKEAFMTTQEYESYNNGTGKTILIAPSWGAKGCLTQYGSDFIKMLAEAGYNIIVRPHPQSLRVEQSLLLEVQENLATYKNVVWDYDVDATRSFIKADILLSDTSSVRFDYLLLYEKPVITLQIPDNNMEEYERANLEQPLAEIGAVVRNEDIESIVSIVEQVLSQPDLHDKITEFRERYVYCWGRSGEKVADYLISQNDKWRLLQKGGKHELSHKICD